MGCKNAVCGCAWASLRLLDSAVRGATIFRGRLRWMEAHVKDTIAKLKALCVLGIIDWRDYVT